MDDEFVLEDEGGEEQAAAKLKKLREKLKACEADKQQYLDGWQRAKADLINTRKDAEEEIRKKSIYATQGLVRHLLPALDSFDIAMKGEAWNKVDSAWRTGVEYIRTQLLSALKDEGFESFSPLGEAFDPHAHEPMRIEAPKEGEAEGIVAEVLQCGWRHKGTVIRPAKVVVTGTPQ